MNLQKTLVAAGLLAALAVPAAHAALTPNGHNVAGSVISNTATLTFEAPDPIDPINNPPVPTTVTDTKNFSVDEVLDVAVTTLAPVTTIVTPGSTQREIRYTVQNTGNGTEQYNLLLDYAVITDDFDPTGVTIWVDTNNDGTVDTQLIGAPTLTLSPEQMVTIVVRGDIPGSANSGDEALVRLRALSDTVQTFAGTTSPFQGLATVGTVVATYDAGLSTEHHAIVGTTLADQQAQGRYLVQAISANLIKDATATHPTLGAGVFAPGSVITYSLTLEVVGDGTLNKVKVVDNIPTDTTYVNGSITLREGTGADLAAATAAAQVAAPGAQAEAANGDRAVKIFDEISVMPGGIDNNTDSGTVTVGGTEPAAKVYIVTFQVTVN